MTNKIDAIGDVTLTYVDDQDLKAQIARAEARLASLHAERARLLTARMLADKTFAVRAIRAGFSCGNGGGTTMYCLRKVVPGDRGRTSGTYQSEYLEMSDRADGAPCWLLEPAEVGSSVIAADEWMEWVAKNRGRR